MAKNNNILKKNSNSGSKNLHNKTLLPYGFHDHIFGEADAELEINNIILSGLKKNGFKLIRPSIIEFEESLDSEYSPNFFKVSDPISGKMMVLRSDITPQIARIIKDKFAEKYLSGDTVKISYTGQVFRKNPAANSSERQLTQTGFEILSKDSLQNDIFTVSQAVSAFNGLKISDYTISFVYPALVQKLYGNLKNLKQIRELIEIKDYQELKKINTEIYEVCKLSDEINDIKSAINLIGKIQKVVKKEKSVFDDLIKFIREISKLGLSNISFDLFESSGFSYHSGLCYSFISNTSFEELGRGGRYEIETGENNISAVGFTFLVNSIIRTRK